EERGGLAGALARGSAGHGDAAEVGACGHEGGEAGPGGGGRAGGHDEELEGGVGGGGGGRDLLAERGDVVFLVMGGGDDGEFNVGGGRGHLDGKCWATGTLPGLRDFGERSPWAYAHGNALRPLRGQDLGKRLGTMVGRKALAR